MCRAAFAIIVFISLIEPAAAQTRFAAPHPQPTALSTQGAHVEQAPDDPTITGAIANAEARKRMDAFDRRIAARSNQAVRSICPDCASDAKQHKWAAKRIEANAEVSEFPIKDPAQAPGE
ncbi:hypothetical protein FV227_18310 [Methylobacterium sp. WL119]|uniref:hypothetical protein n=1 Tax=unclassified Methylobacterium TaxID=2615210 RepID=UPI0011CC4908|nr:MULTISPECIES: hypothetical protein [unclassified Methylobacterium]TXN40727.1 hypothetical protein FV225_05175 [Methylobacterium sp. WL93]TXN49089.1 hypothetical protein FV227_18310 [Methylobacterium sp. WL119]